jgi:hypothetical protein
MDNKKTPPPAKTQTRSTKSLDIDPARIRRSRPPDREEDEVPQPKPVSAGPIEKVIDLAYNPSREKIREMTVIDRWQARLFPILDTVNTMYNQCIEIALYRQSKDNYNDLFKRRRPLQTDIIDELLYRTAQWQKSREGKNLQSATDLALAETETSGQEEGIPSGGDAWKD